MNNDICLVNETATADSFDINFHQMVSELQWYINHNFQAANYLFLHYIGFADCYQFNRRKRYSRVYEHLKLRILNQWSYSTFDKGKVVNIDFDLGM